MYTVNVRVIRNHAETSPKALIGLWKQRSNLLAELFVSIEHSSEIVIDITSPLNIRTTESTFQMIKGNATGFACFPRINLALQAV